MTKVTGSWRPMSWTVSWWYSPSVWRWCHFFGIKWLRESEWCLDLRDTYFQVPVHYWSCKYMGFLCLGRIFQIQALCFGLVSNSQVFIKVSWVLDQCPRCDALILLSNFNAIPGTERTGYEICVGLHGCGTRNDNSSFLLNLARYKRLRIVGSCLVSETYTAQLDLV